MKPEIEITLCKGCKSITEHRICKVARIKNGKFCPCSLCLIKGMCTDPCDEFKAHSDWEQL